jgi:hypothetical protein
MFRVWAAESFWREHYEKCAEGQRLAVMISAIA